MDQKINIGDFERKLFSEVEKYGNCNLAGLANKLNIKEEVLLAAFRKLETMRLVKIKRSIKEIYNITVIKKLFDGPPPPSTSTGKPEKERLFS